MVVTSVAVRSPYEYVAVIENTGEVKASLRVAPR